MIDKGHIIIIFLPGSQQSYLSQSCKCNGLQKLDTDQKTASVTSATTSGEKEIQPLLLQSRSGVAEIIIAVSGPDQ